MRKLVCIGDSVTDANRDYQNIQSLGTGYVSMLKKTFKNATIINSGINGNKTTDLLVRYQKDVLAHKPDVITILIGVNEVWHQHAFNDLIPVDQFRKNYVRLLDWTKEVLPNAKVIVIPPFAFPIGEFKSSWMKDLEMYQQVVKSLHKERNLSIVPMQEILETYLDEFKMADLLPDGVHPSPLGHEFISQHLALVLAKYL